MRERDTLHRFILDGSNVRGELVHLDATWQALLERADYPDNVRRILGEALAAVALLAATVKLEGGTLTLQVSGGSGPLSMLVIQAAGGAMRGLAKWEGEVPSEPLEEVFGGDAHMVLTINPGLGKEQYQGIVELRGRRLDEALQEYFQQSEQLPTRLWLTCDGESAAGLMIQKLPGESEDEDTWDRAGHLAATITQEELLELPAMEVVQRLFHEETVRFFDGVPMSFRCGCSRSRSEGMLRSLGIDELREVIAEQGEVAVTCEFCNASYRFDSVDVEGLFTASHDASRTQH